MEKNAWAKRSDSQVVGITHSRYLAEVQISQITTDNDENMDSRELS